MYIHNVVMKSKDVNLSCRYKMHIATCLKLAVSILYNRNYRNLYIEGCSIDAYHN